MTPEGYEAKHGRIHVMHTLPDLAVSGGQRLVLDLARRLDPQRFMATIVSFSPDGGMWEEFESAGLPPVVLPHSNRIRYATNVMALARTVLRSGVDIIHTHGGVDRSYGAAVAALTRRPLVRHVHGLGRRGGAGGEPPPPPPTGAKRLFRKARSRLVRRAFVAVSEVTYQDRMAAAADIGERVYLVTNGVDAERFRQPLTAEEAHEVRAQLGLRDRSPILVDVAALRPLKGHSDLLEAMVALRERWPRAVLLLVGDGPMRGKLETEARKQGLVGAVHFLGARHDVAAILAISDVFVFPSHAEGFGLAPLEAMASGTPVAAYRLPALEAFITDGETGLLTPVGDAEKLAASVLSLLDDRRRAKVIAEAGRTIAVDRYSIDRSADALGRVYEELVAAPGFSQRGGA